LFHDDPAGRPYQHLEPQAYAGYFLRYAWMFVRNAEWPLAAESFGQARAYWPGFAAGWLADGAARLAVLQNQLMLPDRQPPAVAALSKQLRAPSPSSCQAALQVSAEHAERLRLAWLQYTIEQPFNVWSLTAALGFRRVALFGGEGWGLALYRQLATSGIECAAVIENNASARAAAMIPAPYYSLAEFRASGLAVDAVLSSLQGDHDRDVLPALQAELGPAPVLSWKMLFGPMIEGLMEPEAPLFDVRRTGH
jgi:hypothetical protein